MSQNRSSKTFRTGNQVIEPHIVTSQSFCKTFLLLRRGNTFFKEEKEKEEMDRRKNLRAIKITVILVMD